MIETAIDQQTRELTTLEYVILGFLAIKPQSGYGIITNFEMGLYRMSASTGSIYPVLKRLAERGLISSELEAVHETRPRKIYTLLPAGGALLDEWLRRQPSMAEVIEEYDIAMHKFMIAEYRLSRSEVLAWLDGYEKIAEWSRTMRTALDGLPEALPTESIHTALLNESITIEIEARLTWIHAAQARLRTK
jgi:DNA-binding PadR family transcriptional regulator